MINRDLAVFNREFAFVGTVWPSDPLLAQTGVPRGDVAAKAAVAHEYAMSATSTRCVR